jgi:hypothetical protein
MKLHQVGLISLLFQVGIASAETIKIKNGNEFREIQNLKELTSFDIETTGKIQLLAAGENEPFQIEASADEFRQHAEVEIIWPSEKEPKLIFKLKNPKDGIVTQLDPRNYTQVTPHCISAFSGTPDRPLVIGGKLEIKNMCVSMFGETSLGTVTSTTSPKLNIKLTVPPQFMSRAKLTTSNGRVLVKGFSKPDWKIKSSDSSIKLKKLTDDEGIKAKIWKKSTIRVSKPKTKSSENTVGNSEVKIIHNNLNVVNNSSTVTKKSEKVDPVLAAIKSDPGLCKIDQYNYTIYYNINTHRILVVSKNGNNVDVRQTQDSWIRMGSDPKAPKMSNGGSALDIQMNRIVDTHVSTAKGSVNNMGGMTMITDPVKLTINGEVWSIKDLEDAVKQQQ